jgi:flagellar biosynthetic protein FliR
MYFDFDVAWIIALILIATRLGVLFFATPFDGIGRLPARIRVMAVLVFAAVLTATPGIGLVAVPQNAAELVLLGMQEALIGLAMAFGLYCVFGSIMVAGKLIDFQAGFGAAQILNPATNTANPLVGTVLSLLTLAVFYASDAYLLAVRGIAWSLQISPPGSGLSSLEAASIVSQFGITYIYGIIIAAPVIATLLLLDTGIAVMARSMPQMNVYFLFLPLKIGVALMLTAIALRYLSPVLERLFLLTFRYFQQVIG